jgi:hypothetical protein
VTPHLDPAIIEPDIAAVSARCGHRRILPDG